VSNWRHTPLGRSTPAAAAHTLVGDMIPKTRPHDRSNHTAARPVDWRSVSLPQSSRDGLHGPAPDSAPSPIPHLTAAIESGWTLTF